MDNKVLAKFRRFNQMKKSLFFVIPVLILVGASLYSAMVLNNTTAVFPDPDSGDGIALEVFGEGNPEIAGLMIDGAANFLNSYSEAILLLKEYEIGCKAPFNFTIALAKTNAAIESLESAHNYYSQAISIGEKLQYVELNRNKLLSYDYNTRTAAEKLNVEISSEVTGFLSQGDVIGLYRRNIERVDTILLLLKSIHEKLEAGIKPDVTQFWTVLHNYSETALFGNYATILSKAALK